MPAPREESNPRIDRRPHRSSTGANRSPGRRSNLRFVQPLQFDEIIARDVVLGSRDLRHRPLENWKVGWRRSSNIEGIELTF